MVIPYFSWTEVPFGPLTINVWGLMVALGIFVAVFIAMDEAKRRELPSRFIADVVFWVVLFALIGGRIFFVANEFFLFEDDLISMFKIWEGGLAWFGGLIGGALGLLFALRKHLKKFLSVADVIAFALPAGVFIGRLGCFFIHDHFGKRTICPNCGAVTTGVGDLRFDLGLYLSLNGALLFLLFLLLRKLRPHRPNGFYLIVYMIWTGVSRFALDFLRTTIADSPLTGDPYWGSLTVSQYFSLALLGLGIFLWFRLLKKAPSAG